MEGFEIRVDDRKLTETLKLLDRRVSNMKPFFEETGEIIKTSVIKNFEVGGRYSKPGDWRGGNRKWRPLSTVTLFGQSEGMGRRRGKFVKKRDGGLTSRGRKKLANKKSLIDEGHLLNSVNWRASGNDVEIGTNRVYGAIHQFGGKAGRNKKVVIPARPYMVIQDEDLRQILEVADNFLLKGI